MRRHVDNNNLVTWTELIELGVNVAAMAVWYKQPMRANGAILCMLIE